MGILNDYKVMVDLLRTALDILIDSIHNKIIDEISGFYFA
jgi:hypothetical protein